MSRDYPFPRVGAHVDLATFAAIDAEANLRRERRADFIRAAVENELRVRRAARAAMQAEVERQTSAAVRLAHFMGAGPGAVSARMSEQVARAARPALTTAEAVRDFADRTRMPRRPRSTNKDSST